MRGQFIVLEGIDGSGTTTQAGRLAYRLQEQAHDVLLTREPSAGPIGLLLRQQLSASPKMSPKALALLFAADRLDHVQREILPALEAGKTVISDRYLLSSLAYQGLDCDEAWIQQINILALQADLTFYFHIDPEIAHQRVQSRGGVVERFDALDLQKRIAASYERHVRARQDQEHLVWLDATQAIEALTEEMLSHLP